LRPGASLSLAGWFDNRSGLRDNGLPVLFYYRKGFFSRSIQATFGAFGLKKAHSQGPFFSGSFAALTPPGSVYSI
jgi:hypothetical protein